MRPTPVLVVTLVVALVAAVVVLGEPSRPATATVVRPVVTVPALCSAPTVVDVAARDATRGLTAVGQLLGLPDELVGEAARDVRVVDTEAGAFLILVRDGELRVAALSPAGLPIVNDEVDPPQTYRAFALGDLEGRPSLVIGGPEGVFVVFGGPDSPVQVFTLTPATLASSMEVSVARDADGPVVGDPTARAGSAVVHEGVLWLAGDDGRVVTFDPLAEGSDRWTERATGLIAPLLARGEARVHGLFATSAEDASVEVRSFAAEGDPLVTPVEEPVGEVAGVTYADSTRPAFAVTSAGGAALLRPDDADTSLAAMPDPDGRLLGVVATETGGALLTASAGELRYQVLDAGGRQVGTFGAETTGRCVTGAWPDAAMVIEPISAGSLLHLHDPSSPWDCVVDTRDPAALGEVTERCRPGGAWSVDKGSAPARDFTVEIGRALDELDAEDRQPDPDPDPNVPSSAEAIQEELSDAGLGVIETEVDPEAADECAAEQVTSVVPPVIDLAEPVGSRAIRVEWSWAGGSCLPGSYLVTQCLLADTGSSCADTTEHEVVASPTSGRSSFELPARPDRTYRVSVRAVKGQVISDPSGALLVVTPPVTPDPPIGVSADLTAGTWTLSWSSCLSQGDCDQRPDGFVVTVEGCDGDGLGQLRRRFDLAQRGTTFGADGAGFGGADLLGRRIQFRVATTSGERVSEPVRAGGCTESVRPGRDTTASSLGISLTGRSQRVTLARIEGGRRLTELFGTSRFDDVSARLVRDGTGTAPRTGVLSGSVTFDVARCLPSGWTVELTPRSGGRDLTTHRSRVTDATILCDPAVDGSTRFATSVTGSGASGISLEVTIPQLGHDADIGLVDGVSATTTCKQAFGGEETATLAGGTISGDTVAFTMPVPVIYDLQNACTIAPVVRFTGGGSAAPDPRKFSLDPAAAVIVEAVLPVAVSRLERGRTARYERLSGVAGIGAEDVVVVQHGEDSGVPCARTYGASSWRFDMPSNRDYDCADGAHRVVFGDDQLDDAGDGTIEVRVRLDGILGLGGQSATASRTVPVCQLAGEPQQRPCAPEPEPCEHDPSIPEDDPDCVPRCSYDPGLPADDPACQPCPDDPSMPADDPRCGADEPDPPEQPGTDAAPGPAVSTSTAPTRSRRRG